MTPLQEGTDDDLVIVPRSQVLDYSNIFQYGWSTVNLLMATWIFAAAIDILLHRISYQGINTTYKELALHKRKNVVTYAMQLIVTTFALVLQIYGGWEVIFQFQDSNNDLDRMNWSSYALQLIIVLYLWEVIYRQSIGWPLLIHHVATLLIAQLVTASIHDVGDLSYFRISGLLGMYATTEQFSFVALFCFRLDLFPSWHCALFYLAAAQAFIMKTMITAVGFAYFVSAFLLDGTETGLNWLWFWRISFIPLIIVLYSAQMYAVHILYSLAVRFRKNDDSDDDDSDDDGDDNDSFSTEITVGDIETGDDSNNADDHIHNVDATENQEPASFVGKKRKSKKWAGGRSRHRNSV